MKTLKEGALTIVDGESSLQGEFAEARRLADSNDDHDPRSSKHRPIDLKKDTAKARCVAVLRFSPDIISKGLATLPAEYRPQIEELLATAVNLGKAMEAMDIHTEHGSKIEGKKKSDEALAGLNEGKKYTEEEIERVRTLYDSLKDQFTHAAPLRREIEVRIKDPRMTDRAIRNIIESYILNKPRSKGHGRRK